jgi:hypothetical protein
MVYLQTKNSNLGTHILESLGMGNFATMTICNILLPFGILYGHWYKLGSFGICFPVLVSCTKKNLLTLHMYW